MSPPPAESGYSLIWSDDFSGAAGSLPNQGKWNIITNGPNLGNQEVQHYTNSTSNSDINLPIISAKETSIITTVITTTFC